MGLVFTEVEQLHWKDILEGLLDCTERLVIPISWQKGASKHVTSVLSVRDQGQLMAREIIMEETRMSRGSYIFAKKVNTEATVGFQGKWS
jgi:hypothetical protein